MSEADSPQTASLQSAYAGLLSLAVHELRTPVSVVAGYLRMLQADTEPALSDRQRRMVEGAVESCSKMAGLVAELSEVAKLDAGTAPVSDQAFDLFTLVRDAADGVHDAEDRDVAVEVSTDGAAAPMRGDLTRMRSALATAFRAVAREQPVSTVIAADCRRVLRNGTTTAVVIVAAADTVDAAREAPELPFNEHRGGIGLALAIARRVIERHGGRLWAPALSSNPDPSRRAERGVLAVAFPLAG